MILGDVIELRIANVFDRGIANKECIAISVRHGVNLGRYGLMLAHYDATASKGSLPFFDNLFWWGAGWDLPPTQFLRERVTPDLKREQDPVE